MSELLPNYVKCFWVEEFSIPGGRYEIVITDEDRHISSTIIADTMAEAHRVLRRDGYRPRLEVMP